MRALAIAGIALSALILPSTASAAKLTEVTIRGNSTPKAQFELKASNGFSIDVNGYGRQVELIVADHNATATYYVRGRATTKGIKAKIGNFGRIAVSFKPTGKVHRAQPPKQCKGKEQITTDGVFTGTIQFTGEDGYTRLNAHRATGSTTISHSWKCKLPRGGNGSGKTSAGFPVLSASTPHQRVGFVAFGGDEPEGLGLSIFIGATIERLGSVRIERAAFAEGFTGVFSFERSLSAATVKPPAPFAGEASFVRNPDGSTSWSGTLSVALPGAGVVALTGPSFTANLAKPKTAGELVDLFGLLGKDGLNP